MTTPVRGSIRSKTFWEDGLRVSEEGARLAIDLPEDAVLADGEERSAAAAARPEALTADECATVLATCLRPRRHRPWGLERPKTAERRGLVDGTIVALLFHGALRRSEVAALCWADVDFSDGDDIGVTVRRSKSDPTGVRADVRRLVGGCAAAVRSLHAAVSPAPADSVGGLGVDQINRRFAAACAAAGLEGRRTSHGGRDGLAVELTARGASTHAIQLAGGWKDPAMVVRCAASVSTREGAISKYLRSPGGSESTGRRLVQPASRSTRSDNIY